MTVRAVTPMLVVPDFDATVAFLLDCLGFKAGARMEGYAYCHRDGAAIRVLQGDAPVAGAGELIVYIDVDDVDAQFEAHRAALEALPHGCLRPPFDRDYGQREFHAIHGPTTFMVGQSIE